MSTITVAKTVPVMNSAVGDIVESKSYEQCVLIGKAVFDGIKGRELRQVYLQNGMPVKLRKVKVRISQGACEGLGGKYIEAPPSSALNSSRREVHFTITYGQTVRFVTVTIKLA